MKQGRNLQDLAAELTRQNEAKRDYLADTGSPGFQVEVADGVTTLNFNSDAGALSLPVTDHAQHQIAGRLGLPVSLWKRFRDTQPDMLEYNVNQLFKRENKPQMVRTLDGRVRAFLSDRFRPLDNYDMSQAALPVLQGLGVQIVSCEVTERRLYLKFTVPGAEGDVSVTPGVGDLVRFGGIITNSEIGGGSLELSEFSERLVCLNGMVSRSLSRRTHVGRRNIAGSEIEASQFYTDETKRLDDAAVFAKFSDTIQGMFTEASIEKQVLRLRAARGDRIEHPVQAVQVLAKRLSLPESASNGALEHLLREGDLTRFGFAQALTRHSQDDALSYDAATDLEAVGGDVIALPSNDWKSMMAQASRAAAAA